MKYIMYSNNMYYFPTYRLIGSGGKEDERGMQHISYHKIPGNNGCPGNIADNMQLLYCDKSCSVYYGTI